MLALARNVGESIIIDIPPSDKPRRIQVYLDRITGKTTAKIAVGVEPPDRRVVILRDELLSRRRECDSTTASDSGNSQ